MIAYYRVDFNKRQMKNLSGVNQVGNQSSQTRQEINEKRSYLYKTQWSRPRSQYFHTGPLITPVYLIWVINQSYINKSKTTLFCLSSVASLIYCLINPKVSLLFGKTENPDRVDITNFKITDRPDKIKKNVQVTFFVSKVMKINFKGEPIIGQFIGQ